MSVDVAQELGGSELAAHHVAFQLGHVHPVGREPAQRFVKRRRYVPNSEYERGHEAGCGRLGRHGLFRHDVKARGVVGGVLHIGTQNIQTIDVGRQGRRDGRVFLVGPSGDQFGRTGGVGFDHRSQAQVAQDAADLAERDGVRVCPFEVADRGAFYA